LVGDFPALDKARLLRPLFGSKTWPPRSSQFWANQSGKQYQFTHKREEHHQRDSRL